MKLKMYGSIVGSDLTVHIEGSAERLIAFRQVVEQALTQGQSETTAEHTDGSEYKVIVTKTVEA